jgi:hypothetical protein
VSHPSNAVNQRKLLALILNPVVGIKFPGYTSIQIDGVVISVYSLVLLI